MSRPHLLHGALLAAALACIPVHGRAADARELSAEADRAAERVRASGNAANLSERLARADEAIAMLDPLIARARAARDRDLLVRLLGDRALALRYRERWSDALEQVAKLRADGLPTRPYVREVEADALLALRRPAEARAIYADLAAADPGNRAARIGLFYAEIETEDFAAAFATADALDDPVLSAQARHYAGMEKQAWKRIEPVIPSKRDAAYVRKAAAEIEASRGWTRRAHADLVEAAALAPDDMGIAVALAQSHLRRRHVAEARAIAARLAAAFPGQAAVARLQQEIRDFDGASFLLDVRGRHESGGAAAAPGPGMEAHGRVYSRLVDDAFRFFAGGGYATARPPEGDALRNRIGAGVEWRGPDAAVEGSAWSNGGDVSRSGIAVSASWSASDFFSLAADYERYAWETPLRAVLHGITSNGGGIGMGLSWDESRGAWIGYRDHDFTDGNHRRQARIAWAERVVEQPTWTLTLRPELYASRNSLGASAPYFNPSRDFAASLAVDAQRLLWRRYEESFRHRIIVRGGLYRQEGFADGFIGGVTYEQAWQPGRRLELRWGVDVGRARYDGANENVVVVFLAASGRF